MKNIILTIFIVLFSISYTLASDESPTAESNKAAFDIHKRTEIVLIDFR